MPAPSIFSADWRNELLKWLTAAFQPLSAALTSWAGVTRASGFDTFAATPSSANLRALLTDETGTGAAYFQGGALGTPASGTLTNCTGLPNASVIGLGTAALKNTGTSGNNVPLLDGANTFSATQALALAQPSIIVNSTDATQFARVLFQEAGGNTGAFQVIGSTFGTTSRRGNLELISTTTGNDFTITTNGNQLRLTVKKAGDVLFGDSANTLPVPVTIYGSFSRGAPVTKTADFTVGAAENNLINNKSGSSCTVTLPAASSFVGREIYIKNMQAQTVVSASSNVVPRGSTSAGTAILASGAGNWALLVSDGTNWVIIAGS